MIPQPPPGQGPIDPRGALSPPPPPGGGAGPAGWVQPPQGTPAPGQGPVGVQSPSLYPPAQQQPAAGMPMQSQQQRQQPFPPPYQPGSYAPPPQGFLPPGMRAPFFASPPPPRRGGMGRFIGLFLLLAILVISLLVNLALISTSIGGGSGTLTTVVTTGDHDQQVAVLPLVGIIDANMEARFERFLDRAEKDTNVKAVVILIDTPGGTVSASDEIYKRIRRFKADRNVPVIAAMRSYATSGGYYAACATDYITAERTTLTGNIGVLAPRWNYAKLMEKYGVEDTTIVATGATFKNAGSPYRPPNPAGEAYLQDQIDSAFQIFKQVVVDGRKAKLTSPIDSIANGKVYSGEDALKLGLVDAIDPTGYLDAAVKYATTTARLDKPQVVRYQEQPSLLELLASSAKYTGGAGKASGVTINIDASAIDRITAPPQAMYLYRAPAGGTD